MDGSTHISTWVNADTRLRFAAVARHHGLSESALLKQLIEQMFVTVGEPDPAHVTKKETVVRGSRLTVRLQPDDRLILQARAEARRMPTATYISALIRAHLRSLAPLPKDELAALKLSVAELRAIGRNLNQIALMAHQTGGGIPPVREDLRAMLKVCEALRDHVRALIRANRTSWQVGYGERND